jgi:hypothetical protein
VRELCGARLGWGVHREVFELAACPSRWVVKVERDMSAGAFANALEWRNYVELGGDPVVGPWLAPVAGIDETGRVLLQRRVRHLPLAEMPPRVPSWLTDLKTTNFGRLEGRVVCCDYSSLLRVPLRMKRARWWEL